MIKNHFQVHVGNELVQVDYDFPRSHTSFGSDCCTWVAKICASFFGIAAKHMPNNMSGVNCNHVKYMTCTYSYCMKSYIPGTPNNQFFMVVSVG